MAAARLDIAMEKSAADFLHELANDPNIRVVRIKQTAHMVADYRHTSLTDSHVKQLHWYDDITISLIRPMFIEDKGVTEDIMIELMEGMEV